MPKRRIEPFQAGFGGSEIKYCDLQAPLELSLGVHDTTNDVLLTVAGRVDDKPAWVDIEMDFDNAKRLIAELQDAIDRKSPYPTFMPS